MKSSIAQTYSKVATTPVVTQYPKKNQAIVFDSIDGVRDDEYIYAIAMKTRPENIVAASKITQNRFCCYFNSASIVDQLTQEGNNELLIDAAKVTIKLI